MLAVNEEMASVGLRILGIAYKEMSGDLINYKEETAESELVFLGLIGMMDPPT